LLKLLFLALHLSSGSGQFGSLKFKFLTLHPSGVDEGRKCQAGEKSVDGTKHVAECASILRRIQKPAGRGPSEDDEQQEDRQPPRLRGSSPLIKGGCHAV
jgi:hypothetical protein